MWKSNIKNVFSYQFPRWSKVSLIAQSLTCLPGRLINNKKTYPIRCFAQVFLCSRVFYVNIWTGMASNNTISWSATYDSTVQYQNTAQNTDLFPPWTRLCIADSSARLDELCPYFCLNPMVVHRKTSVLMYLKYVYAPFMTKITFDTQNLGVSLWQLKWLPKLRCTTPGVWLRLSRLIYARSARSDSPGIS